MSTAIAVRERAQISEADDLPPRLASVNGDPNSRRFRPQDRRSAPAAEQASAGGIERLCLERGLKMTGQRRIIARILSEAVDHPDVEELYRRASALDERISIATVYRTVRLFEEKGILQRRDFGSGRARYEPAQHGHHYHLIDVDSGKVVEFTSLEHERLVRAVAEQLGFDVVSLRLEVFGRRHAQTGEPGAPKHRGEGES